MANFKIFQDTPSQAQIQIFGSNTGTAVNTDSLGNVGITSPGLAITPPTGGLTITSTGLAITPPADGLSITSTGLAITPPADGLSITSIGLAITPPAGGLLITTPSGGLLVTGTLLTSTATTEVITSVLNNADTDGGPAAEQNVLTIPTYTYSVVNNSTVANAQAIASLQVSPDAINWTTQSGPVTINQASLYHFVSSIFTKYARIYYNAVNATSAVTLDIYFVGQLSQ